jgi:2-polyprenyl-3-methyl-5-hydroxy-6-metoxy-1,4-benzoquinol methylase
MEFEIKEDEKCGYKHISPIPDASELSDFYQSDYPEMLQEGEAAEDVARLIEGGEEAERERAWRRATWYADVQVLVEAINSDVSRVLDVGAGTGEFLAYMQDNGFDVVGLEPSSKIGEVARSKGLTIHATTLEPFAETTQDSFDVVTLFHVLEHVPNPVEVLEAARSLLGKRGLLIVKVPNEFNSLQLAARDALDLGDWWMVPPVHINYFDYDSLRALMNETGFSVETEIGNFPMEMFLLMGENYVEDSETGSECHWKRVRFEESIPGRVRRTLYKKLATTGLGRSATLIGSADA